MKYKRFKKPRYCPNAASLGYSRPYVSMGDLILYREYYADGSFNTRLARVLGLATEDGLGEKYKSDVLLVIAADDMLSFGYERHIKLKDVAEVRTPGPFAKWFLYSTMIDAETTIEACNYGSLSNQYIEKYLDANGDLSRNWRKIAEEE